MNRLSIALLHHPVVDRHGELYTTAITNIDVHDIARSSRTYDLSQYYIISPILAQRELAETIATFWIEGGGSTRNRDRTCAMELISVQSDLEACIEHERSLGHEPLLIATSAKPSGPKTINYQKGRELIEKSPSTILLFGTGYGLAPSVIDLAHHVLEPIYGPKDYNHLSVRSAAAIILDRLCAKGER